MDGFMSILIFFKILFFADTVLLTPNPIDIINEYEIKLEKPISAITSGAYIMIDVSNMTSKLENIYPDIYNVLPPNSIMVYLYTTQGDRVALHYIKGFSGSGTNNWIHLYAKKDMIRTNVYYNKVLINSKIPLNNIEVSWRNCTM